MSSEFRYRLQVPDLKLIFKSPCTEFILLTCLYKALVIVTVALTVNGKRILSVVSELF